MTRAAPVLADHPVNRARVAAGKRPANAIWLWGQGRAPSVPRFAEVHGLDGRDHLGGQPGPRRGRARRLDPHRRPGRDRLSRHRLRSPRARRPSRPSRISTSSACTSRRPTRRATRAAPTPRSMRSSGSTRTSSAPCAVRCETRDRWRMVISPDHSTLLRTRAHDRTPVAWAMAGTGLPASGRHLRRGRGARGRLPLLRPGLPAHAALPRPGLGWPSR